MILVTVVALAGLALVLLLTRRSMASSFHDDGLAHCIEGLARATSVPVEAGCQDEAAAFASRYFPMRTLGLAVFTFVPLVFGMFWGAPVVARELEDDTASLVWTQRVSRRRWAWSQLGFVTLATVLAMGIFSWLVTWWYGPLNAATGDRFQWLIFDQQGLVPVGYAVFAVLLAAFVGAITGRTLRAMAVTVLGFILVRFPVAVWLRPRFMSGVERTYPVVGVRVPNHLLGDWLFGPGGPGVGVVLAANGDRIAGGQRICAPLDQACFAETGRGAYNLELFHPASRFWTFQAIELTLFLVMAMALAGATVWWVRRRLV
jgi:hypothetical protein